MSDPTRGPAKPPKHGEIGCEISARVTDKRNWVLCRTCLNTQHSQTKGKSKALTGYFRPIIISHKSQTSQDHCLWQHDWWVCRRECQEKWSPAPYLPYFSLWVSLGVFMEKSHGRCDEHYFVIMKGTLLYCQPLQTGGDLLAAERLCPFMHLCALMSLSGDQDKWAYLYIYTMSAPWLLYQLQSLFKNGNVKR